MATQFLSRVEREVPQQEFSTVGPGQYKLQGSMRNSLPGFAPFSSNTKRMVYTEEMDGPSPGAYELAKDLAKKTYGAGSLHSKTQRFNDGTPASVRNAPAPGPGQYPLPGSFERKKVGGGRRDIPLNDALLNSLGGPACTTMAPSIPTKYQSYGYESGADGRLALQDPLYPVYSGKQNDAVGPCEYDPKINVRYKSAPKVNFGKGSERGAIERISAKMQEAPGPGYYNYRSEFDLPEEAGGNSYADTNFLMQLNAARKRQSAVFESRTARDALMQEVKRRQGEPGPGTYDLGTTIKSETKPDKVQNFASSGQRFQDPTPRSMRLTTAPGAYSPVTSDFDQLRLRIMKQKKMAVRSGWAQNIAFTSTESRFAMNGQDLDGPPANAYYPKVGIADNLPRPNKRGGAFGAKEKRFKDPKGNFEPIRDPHHLATVALNQELASFMPPAPEPSRSSGSFSPSSHHASGTRAKFTSNFAPSLEERMRPVKTPPGPPPGAYDVQPKWNKVGTHVMAPMIGQGKGHKEKMPGPGQYNLDRQSHNWRNPKNIMLSSSAREVWSKPNAVPGPGEYNVVPMEGGLLRPSHNVLLSDNY